MKLIKISTMILTVLLINHTLIGDDEQLQKKVNSKYLELTKTFDCKSIEAKKLKALIDKNEELILVDIREKKEQKVSMLPNAIKKEEFIKNFEHYKDKKIIAYCTIGYRSGKFAEKFKNLNILNLEGGILSWSHAQGKFYVDKKETKMVHTYSDRWNFLHSNYKAVTK